jgi:RNA polymerase sigma factor (sigma-70 family)
MSLPPFQSLLDEHGAAVLRYLQAGVGPHDGADCYQETLLAALRTYADLRDPSNLRAWLFTIAHRKMIDHHRARARVPVAVGVPPALAYEPADVDDDELWSKVRNLPPMQRSAVLHRFMGDLSYAEIASIIGCSEAAARQNVRAGLAKLREEYVR